MTFKIILATVLMSVGFLAFGIGLGMMCTAIIVETVCGGTIITLVGFTLIVVGGFITFS